MGGRVDVTGGVWKKWRVAIGPFKSWDALHYGVVSVPGAVDDEVRCHNVALFFEDKAIFAHCRFSISSIGAPPAGTDTSAVN
jgi:hypothetical protein